MGTRWKYLLLREVRGGVNTLLQNILGVFVNLIFIEYACLVNPFHVLSSHEVGLLARYVLLETLLDLSIHLCNKENGKAIPIIDVWVKPLFNVGGEEINFLLFFYRLYLLERLPNIKVLTLTNLLVLEFFDVVLVLIYRHISLRLRGELNHLLL